MRGGDLPVRSPVPGQPVRTDVVPVTSQARFDGAVALVTGAASGIGTAIATRLAAEGASVCIADRDLPGASRVAAAICAAGGKAVAEPVDVADRRAVEACLDRVKAGLGPVDVLVNNAAVVSSTDLKNLTEEEWDRDLAVCLKGAFLCAKAVLPDMLQRRKGVLLNIGSVNGSHFYGDDAYSAAKAGLVSLTRSLAVRYGAYGVRANLIAPGTVRTPAWDERLRRDPDLLQTLAQWYPLGRLGTVEDIAAAAAFLASDEASWITGTTLTVDGGLVAGNAVMA